MQDSQDIPEHWGIIALRTMQKDNLLILRDLNGAKKRQGTEIIGGSSR